MHCRPSSPFHDTTCSSFLFPHPDYINTINHRTCSSLSDHDQLPTRPSTPRRRRRLEDIVITYASNYYATYPRQTPALSSQSPPVPLPRRIDQQSEDNGIYCDLFNLLERPSPTPPPVKQRRKYTLNDYHSRRRHASAAYKSAHAKMKDIYERKRHHYKEQQSSYYRDKKDQEYELASIQPYDRLQENVKDEKCICRRHSPSKGFFRRVARNYFCMPMTVANAEFSN